MRTALDPVTPVPAFHTTAVTPYFMREDWLVSAITSIGDIAALPADWNSYGSVRLTPAAKAQALELALRMSHALPEPHIAPVSGGGLQFEWTVGPRSLELEVLPDGAIDYLRVYADDTMREGRVNPGLVDHINQQVRWLIE